MSFYFSPIRSLGLVPLVLKCRFAIFFILTYPSTNIACRSPVLFSQNILWYVLEKILFHDFQFDFFCPNFICSRCFSWCTYEPGYQFLLSRFFSIRQFLTGVIVSLFENVLTICFIFFIMVNPEFNDTFMQFILCGAARIPKSPWHPGASAATSSSMRRTTIWNTATMWWIREIAESEVSGELNPS